MCKIRNFCTVMRVCEANNNKNTKNTLYSHETPTSNIIIASRTNEQWTIEYERIHAHIYTYYKFVYGSCRFTNKNELSYGYGKVSLCPRIISTMYSKLPAKSERPRTFNLSFFLK